MITVARLAARLARATARALETYSPCACNCTPCRAGAHCGGSACEKWS